MDDLVYRLRTRASIRRNISTRKSVQEGKEDKIASLLEEAANRIEKMGKRIDWLELELKLIDKGKNGIR